MISSKPFFFILTHKNLTPLAQAAFYITPLLGYGFIKAAPLRRNQTRLSVLLRKPILRACKLEMGARHYKF